MFILDIAELCFYLVSYPEKGEKLLLGFQVLIRRAQVADVLPGNYEVNTGQDIMISVYNIHRSAQVVCNTFSFIVSA